MKLKNLTLGFMTTILSMSSVLAHVGDDDYGHHGMMGQWFGGYGGMWGWGFNSILISVILILLIILLIIIIQKQLQKK